MAAMKQAWRAILVCVTAAAGMAAPAWADGNPGPCPGAFVLYDAVRVVNFGESSREAFDNVGFTAEIQAVRSLCKYRSDRPIVADLELDIGFGRGPAADGREHTYTYWVAVTRADSVVIAKEFFPVTVKFGRDEQTVYQRERIEEIVIPRANADVSGSNFEIIVGFDVTPEQLEFNRLGKRFTIQSAASG